MRELTLCKMRFVSGGGRNNSFYDIGEPCGCPYCEKYYEEKALREACTDVTATVTMTAGTNTWGQGTITLKGNPVDVIECYDAIGQGAAGAIRDLLPN